MLCFASSAGCRGISFLFYPTTRRPLVGRRRGQCPVVVFSVTAHDVLPVFSYLIGIHIVSLCYHASSARASTSRIDHVIQKICPFPKLRRPRLEDTLGAPRLRPELGTSHHSNTLLRLDCVRCATNVSPPFYHSGNIFRAITPRRRKETPLSRRSQWTSSCHRLGRRWNNSETPSCLQISNRLTAKVRVQVTHHLQHACPPLCNRTVTSSRNPTCHASSPRPRPG
ncbi:hypothetical protein TNIN_242761 [Trichonephila inaurata madagascariensis]|uniref:Uncharacterized protein n=1 Tax=Trichonephila inaurata madagascariensis TaxID=2747483 RepID=A0A8X6XC35_9ARAC|nr:hypothetical protein TNIN_242761 [Trichonephila inaurata madagascariensis]